jgi:hypothetical protein
LRSPAVQPEAIGGGLASGGRSTIGVDSMLHLALQKRDFVGGEIEEAENAGVDFGFGFIQYSFLRR